MTSFAFNVRLKGKLIDIVFYQVSKNQTIAGACADVRKSLIGHDGYSQDIAVTWPRGQRITETSYELHGDYGQGFELLTSAATFKGARQHKKDYLENSPCPLKIIKRMERK